MSSPIVPAGSPTAIPSSAAPTPAPAGTAVQTSAGVPPSPAGTVVTPPSGAEILAKAKAEKAAQEAAVGELVLIPLRRSDTIGQIAGALAKAQGQIGAASRDSDNLYFKSKYASLASVLDACRAALSANEIAYFQPVTARGRMVIITTLLAHSSGEWIEERLVLTAQQDTPQAIGSAMTFGRRYGLAAMVGVAPTDDDGEAATHGLPAGVKWDKGARSGQHQARQGTSDEIPDADGAPTPEPATPTTEPPPTTAVAPPMAAAPAVRPAPTVRPTSRPAVPAMRAAAMPKPAGSPPPPMGKAPMKAPTGE